MRQFFRSEGVDKWCETEIKMILEGERDREKRRRERIFEKDIYNNTQYICTCSQYPNY